MECYTMQKKFCNGFEFIFFIFERNDAHFNKKIWLFKHVIIFNAEKVRTVLFLFLFLSILKNIGLLKNGAYVFFEQYTCTVKKYVTTIHYELL
jgi:hypothetical protein